MYIKRALKNKQFMICISGIICLFGIICLAPYIAPYSPYDLFYEHILQSPNTSFLMGTDHLGRDVFSRVLYGGMTSLVTAIAIVCFVAVIGMLLGVICALSYKWVDTVVMRLSDMILAFPSMIFTIVIVSVLGTGTVNIIVAISVTGWVAYARVVRAMILSLKHAEFIEEAKLGGAKTPKLFFTYLLPNIMPHILVLLTQDFSEKLLTLSSLSLLGLGAQPPHPEWGYMLSEGKPYIQHAPWLLVFPGLAIFISVILFSLLGDSLREILDPKENIKEKRKKKMSLKKFTSKWSILIALLFVLVGCGTSKMEEKAETKEAKHLTAALYWFGDDLDPANGWNAWTLSRIGAAETLVTVNEHMKFEPQLADKWEVVNEKTWKFHIRQGVKFSNGKVMTPEDVKKSIERVISKDERAKSNAKLDKIEVDGEYVLYHTTEPYGSLLANLTEPLFTIIDTSQPEESIATKPVTTGPYAVKELKKEEQIELVANEHYWNGKPGLDTLTVRNIEDDDTRLLALQSGDVQIAQKISGVGLEQLSKNADFQILEVPSLRVYYMALNHKNAFLKDKEIRQAMAYAIDREKLAKIVRGEAVGAAFPRSAGYGYDKIDKQSYDSEKAKDLLAKAGFVAGSDGILEKDGKKLAFTLSLAQASPLAEVLQSQLKEVGIALNINLTENINESKVAKDFDIFLFSYITATTGDSKRFMEQNYSTHGTDNFGSYSNPEFDKIVEELVTEFDQQKRVELTIQGQQILNKDVANIYLTTGITNSVATKKVKNVVSFPIDYYFITKDLTVE
ncbi:ABC transporter permease subunit [Carnobacteriaceae bacterium zg-ZUI78]|nr:ABC transporter permease subunit [Carnobacteriaceae bacterium zg-ZUI78]